MNAFKQKKVLGQKIQTMQMSGCSKCDANEFHEYYLLYTHLTKVNTDITNECGLKPIVLHICKVLTPELKMKEVIVLEAKKDQVNKTTVYTCLYVETDENEQPQLSKQGKSK